ncbi:MULTISPECIES: SMC-Scp complex subunit ScpB [unclassified Treponema]|uniref:SMC-Scp complex subunit ScpB n=1 Tax=unclassified Treponema TaxID=2638727 RepID=UPI0020A4D9F2|nr:MULTISPECIES: SMC-Scp complex subunit ScpB [unclassified Treponema]UTC66331.1 SMC-Scp complex subunit ScpB [Treponema sp. OMZ 789]UTC69061.1 SMC-Scp complex subunit ScpB [Treponema sp. OMZ 790]UTC71773.1 SMC-Scp complex subunit ScpB [Treponema sp. OMZ 791]
MVQNYNLEKEISLIEAILYLEGDPLTDEALCKISGLSPEIVNDAIKALQEAYAAPQSGIELAKMMGGWVIMPKKELWEHLKDRYGKKNEGRLSRAAMETLSIIAYSQPVTRAEIEAIRGVSADNMIRLLVEKDLIKEVGKKDVPGKPSMFGTTKEFLKVFRLNSIADLPKLDETESERFELAR